MRQNSSSLLGIEKVKKIITTKIFFNSILRQQILPLEKSKKVD